ncbi:acetyltransferase f_3 family protein [Candidatus Nitrosoglobus terrae]|uniref:Acetyltransferase f_3 family protein n=1 Tax=Candidatus Nitrosoglobus terrae TaxID=1630141 RepID=A0A1Q2SM07_9GAMM|nr:GNAT family N-acetyltransferase [Candidatus Nitrosoglobus terrae]BAW80137.1 acetyltransferase f_3 family protein [Candidatus Nitrosoglobus terrae]
MAAPSLKTSRLLLRQWHDKDLPLFATMNADPQVMEFFPAPLDKRASDELVFTIQANLKTSLFGLWAVEILDVARFAGFIGLSVPRLEAPFMPAIEIAWRLALEYWGEGYATEGAQAVLKYGFEVLKLPEIIAFTAAINLRSIRVMQRI